MHVPSPVVVFVEADSVVLPATRQDCETALDAFADLARDNIAMVLCSGATRSQLDSLASALDIWHPFICEDGSAVFVPQGYFGADVPGARRRGSWEVVEFARAHRAVIETVADTAARLGIEIVAASGMAPAAAAVAFGWPTAVARRAVKRQYGEVFRLRHPDPFARARLVRRLRREPLRCTRRGFDNYVVPDTGGADAVALLLALFDRYCPAVRALGLAHGERSGIVAAALDGVLEIDCPDLQALAHVTRDAVAALRAGKTAYRGARDAHGRARPGRR
jgi:predicted mannosyl-3-phosphoglycerate phosphatase (HAD superfamily)